MSLERRCRRERQLAARFKHGAQVTVVHGGELKLARVYEYKTPPRTSVTATIRWLPAAWLKPSQEGITWIRGWRDDTAAFEAFRVAALLRAS